MGLVSKSASSPILSRSYFVGVFMYRNNDDNKFKILVCCISKIIYNK